jgi:hypothetical protein
MTIQQYPAPAGGIPTGATADRPASPSIGDVFYNGTLAILEIYDGTAWVPCSAPAATPTISVSDVGTSVAYGSAQGLVTITDGTSGGPADSFLISASTGGYTATTTGTTVTITVGNNGSWTFSGQGINNFGTSVAGPSTSATLTTVPQAPTIGTATTSGVTSDVTVTWTLGNNGGKNLTAITITPYLNGTTAQTATTAATTTATSATITGLTQGSSYTFKVKTTNANGISNESSATNSITVPGYITVDYLVVAGGGGGGGNTSGNASVGGGGAGGLRSTVTATGGGGSLESALTLAKGTNYTVTVGGGGAGGVYNSTDAVNGTDSVFGSITSIGGGHGGSVVPGPAWDNPGSGGSGGGGGGNGANGGAGTANQGYAGGQGPGGGGGAGEAGDTDADFDGGDGVAVSITGSSVTYAGGGAAKGGNGGAGGGGGDNTAGTTNSGGGGGSGSAGGSGVVILRWLTSGNTITVGAGLTADATGTDGSYSYKKFTAGSGNVSFS